MAIFKHPPQQPIVVDADGNTRFVGNAIVKYITEHGGFDFDHLAKLDFPAADKSQFAQLLGHTVEGVVQFVERMHAG